MKTRAQHGELHGQSVMLLMAAALALATLAPVALIA